MKTYLREMNNTIAIEANDDTSDAWTFFLLKVLLLRNVNDERSP